MGSRAERIVREVINLELSDVQARYTLLRFMGVMSLYSDLGEEVDCEHLLDRLLNIAKEEKERKI